MKIDIIEHCFGPDVWVNDETLHKHEYDKRDDASISKLKESLLSELLEIKDELDMGDWRNIAQIIVYRGKYSLIDGGSHNDYCDQCGNYNYREAYEKIMDNE